MGSCVSAYKNYSASAASIPPSPIKPKPTADDPPIVAAKWSPPRSTRGSKEDAFFDSKPWLDSDCEDDFYSVKGDFTPSRGSTPVHPSFSVGSDVQYVKASLEQGKINAGCPNGSSPGSQKKKLAQLFSESTSNDGGTAFGNAISAGKPVAIAKPTILNNPGSVCSAETTPNGDLKPKKERSVRSLWHCLPRLTYCGSFREMDNQSRCGS